MKFVCNDCRETMEFIDNNQAEDGSSMAISYGCPNCGRSIAMITNPGETQMVRSLDVTIGHEPLSTPARPMGLIRDSLAGQQSTTASGLPEPIWTEKALKRLAAAPTFVQSMVRHLYTDYARQKGYPEITPAIMTEAREALGMTEM